MFTRVFFGILGMLSLAVLTGPSGLCGHAPNPIAPKKEEPKKEAPLPNMEMESNWGRITQKGRVLSITGHPVWDGEGTIRPDGTVLIIWTSTFSGRAGPGVYSWDGERLIGSWGFAEEVFVEPDGGLSGRVKLDQVYRVKD